MTSTVPFRSRLLCGAAIALVACAGGDRASKDAGSEVPKAERYGGTAVVAGLAEFPSLNELVSLDFDADQVLSFVLGMTLVQYDENLNPVPYLAERWDTLRFGDGTMGLRFHLRRDVRWHDGVPTTAHDVKFTFDRAKDPAYRYPNAGFFTYYDSARVEDDYTVALYFRPHAEFIDPWRVFTPMPKHVLDDVGPEEMLTHPSNTQHPLGNGPYRFVSHTSQDRWVFEANPDFPEALGGRPYLDRLVYRIIPEETTLLTELLTGGVDVSLLVLPDHAGRIETNPATRLLAFPSRQYVFAGWNERRPFFESAAVRRALTHAIDRHQIVEVVRHGYGRVAHGPIPPFHWAHRTELDTLAYDPARARAILEAEGWIDRDGDGVRERDGLRFSFELKTNQNRVREDIVQLIQADLAAVGIEVRPRVMEWAAFVDDVVRSRRFDAVVLGLINDFRIDHTDLFACARLQGPFQFVQYCNPRVDTLLTEMAKSTTRAEALPLWYEYQEIMIQDQPYTWIYHEIRPVAVRTRLRDVQMDIRGTWINAKDWWIAPGDRTGGPRTAER